MHHVDACEVGRGKYNTILPIPYTFYIIIVTKMMHPQTL
jgi:hypothetical protein